MEQAVNTWDMVSELRNGALTFRQDCVRVSVGGLSESPVAPFPVPLWDEYYFAKGFGCLDELVRLRRIGEFHLAADEGV